MIEAKSADWREKYEEALKETDQRKLTTKIDAAEFALFVRLQELPDKTVHLEEVVGLYEAIHALKLLRPREAN